MSILRISTSQSYLTGKSVQNRDLWVMVVSIDVCFPQLTWSAIENFSSSKKVSSSPYEHMLGKPDVKYVGGIHGNEAVGRELLLHLIQYFVTNYQTDSYVKWLLDNTRIHILPSLNVSEFFDWNSFPKSLESIIRGWFINFSTLRALVLTS